MNKGSFAKVILDVSWNANNINTFYVSDKKTLNYLRHMCRRKVMLKQHRLLLSTCIIEKLKKNTKLRKYLPGSHVSQQEISVFVPLNVVYLVSTQEKKTFSKYLLISLIWYTFSVLFILSDLVSDLMAEDSEQNQAVEEAEKGSEGDGLNPKEEPRSDSAKKPKSAKYLSH